MAFQVLEFLQHHLRFFAGHCNFGAVFVQMNKEVSAAP